MTDRPWRLLSVLPLPEDVVRRLLGDVAERTELTLLPLSTPAELQSAMKDVELVLGTWKGHRTAHLDADAASAAGPDLVFVQQPSAGVDVLDVPAFTARGVPVANAPGSNARAVAEWMVGATLALSRQLVWADAAVRAGSWPQIEVTRRGHGEIGGLRVGILGLGAIGRLAAQLFAAFGCEVAYWSRSPRSDVPYARLEPAALCARSDVLVLALPLTQETRGLVSTDLLATLPAGAYVVNACRGAVLDDRALLAAIESGHLGGAALDVFPVEPLPADDPLRTNDRVLLSPHAAGATRQAFVTMIEMSVGNLRRVLDGIPVRDVVNGLPAEIRRRSS